jgi:hypothetical protein
MSKRTPVIDPPRMLVEGQNLDQPTFHALYEATPPGTRAELINGVVHMPSPFGGAHSLAQVPVIVWLDYYAEKTVGVEGRGSRVRRTCDRPGRDLLVRPGSGCPSEVGGRRRRTVPFDCFSRSVA